MTTPKPMSAITTAASTESTGPAGLDRRSAAATGSSIAFAPAGEAASSALERRRFLGAVSTLAGGGRLDERTPGPEARAPDRAFEGAPLALGRLMTRPLPRRRRARR